MNSKIVILENGELVLSDIVLGTCYFGSTISQSDSFALLDRYYELGGRTIDTARVYGQIIDNGDSASERTIGKWLDSRGVRSEITLVTKGAHPPIGYMNHSRLDRKSILDDITRSLELLKTDSVDLFLLHRDDSAVPVEEIVDTLDLLVKNGMTKAVGVSNWKAGRIAEANAYAEKSGKTKISVSQIQWSLARTTPEALNDPTLVCMNREEYFGSLKNNIPVMAFSSQCKGLFSKYIQNGEKALNDKIRQRFLNDFNLQRVEKVREVSKEYGVSPSAVVLSYITSNPLSGVAIIGCSDLKQLNDSMASVDFCLSIDEIKYLTDNEGY